MSQNIRSTVVAAATTAAAMIAFQVGAKATRDAFFLATYPVGFLPAMMAATSVLAIGLAYAATRLLTRWGPNQVVPAAFGVSGFLLLLEWAVALGSPRIAAVLLYLHYGCFGALLVSGFWSFLSERFDPRTAKRELGRIMAAGTVGGLVGGLIATLVGRFLPVTAMIPILAVFHWVCALSTPTLRLGPALSIAPGSESQLREDRVGSSDVRTLATTPYLRGLIGLVVLVTISEGLIDLMLKGRAVAAMGEGGTMLRFFAVFYASVALCTVIVQAVASRIALSKLGPARTVAVLPAGAMAAAAGALAVPGLAAAAVARGVESVLSNSLYRGGYEVLFTPVPTREKRAIKALVDVGASRLGDIAAAGIAQAVVIVPMANQGALLIAAVASSLVAFYCALRLHGGYVQTLARGLMSRAVQLDPTDVQDSLTRSAVLLTLGPQAFSRILELPQGEIARVPGPPGPPGDPSIAAFPPEIPAVSREEEDQERIRELTSRDSARVLRALEDGPLTAALVPHLVRLLAWDDVAREAIAALRTAAPQATDHLVERLLDRDEEFTIRRRIPLVLATYKDPRAFQGLMGGLADRRFEVRYRCGRGLARMLDADPSLPVPREEVFAAVRREVERGGKVWESRKHVRMDDEGWSPVVDEMLRDRANRSLEHVFTLLALVLPREPLRIAFKGLHTNDPHLRGTALEYLESSLPPEVRRPLWPYLDPEDSRARRTAPVRPQEEVLKDLFQSSASITLNLQQLRDPDHPR